jgi:type IV fimbrial biogenesis protein FimT
MLRLRRQGFSVIELGITLAVLGLLIVMGLPDMAAWLQNTQVRTAAESVYSGLQLARAEAVRRNAKVRFRLTSTAGAGLSDWSVHASDDGGATFAVPVQTRSSVQGSTNARVGVSDTPTTPAYTVAIGSGTNLPASVVFTPVGRAEAEPGVQRITRVDVTSAALAAAEMRRLVLVVTLGGQVRMCDPQHALSSNPTGCI